MQKAVADVEAESRLFDDLEGEELGSIWPQMQPLILGLFGSVQDGWSDSNASWDEVVLEDELLLWVCL